MKKNLFTLLALCAFLVMPNIGKATDYTIKETPDPVSPILSYVIPLVPQTSTASSITQQIYLASDLTSLEASAGSITGIKFYYGGKLDSGTPKSPTAVTTTVTRSLKIYLTTVDDDALTCYEISGYMPSYRFKFLNQGSSLVYEGDVETETTEAGQIKTLPITFNKGSFAWDGSSNLLLTIFDVTNSAYSSAAANLRFELMNTEEPRFVHLYWGDKADDKAEDYLNTLAGLEGWDYQSKTGSDAREKQINGHKYVAKITFCIDELSIPSIPTGLTASDASTNSITLSWNTASSATAYDLQYKDGDSWEDLASDLDETSYSWTERAANTSYEVRVRASNSAGHSDWSSAVTVTTDAVHEHNGISFEKWTSSNSLPTSGNYYLATDVAYDFYEGGYLDLAGDLNLCLNGHTINLGTKSINVTNGKTMTIFDHVGGGKITGFVPGQDGSYTYQGVISVENGGTLILREGEVENTYPADNPEYKSIAIAVGGTLILSGSPVISSNEMDIYLPPTIPAKVITIEPGKPLTNTTPYRVYKESGVLTSGWANMSGADPKDYFVSANPGKSICLREGEAALQTLLTLSETALNSAINSNDGQIVDVNLTRPLVASQYNTLCLPFALDNTQLEEYFGAGYDLEELTSTSLEDDMLNLTFNKVTALEAGKPYLLQPADDVSSVMFFDDVTIVKTLSNTVTSYVDFHGTYAPTELEGGNKNLLFLGTGNELFYPSTTANIYGFRAYFEVKGAAQKNGIRARIVKKEDMATGFETVSGEGLPVTGKKILRNGQLFIIRDGKTYNAQGQLVK